MPHSQSTMEHHQPTTYGLRFTGIRRLYRDVERVGCRQIHAGDVPITGERYREFLSTQVHLIYTTRGIPGIDARLAENLKRNHNISTASDLLGYARFIARGKQREVHVIAQIVSNFLCEVYEGVVFRHCLRRTRNERGAYDPDTAGTLVALKLHLLDRLRRGI